MFDDADDATACLHLMLVVVVFVVVYVVVSAVEALL